MKKSKMLIILVGVLLLGVVIYKLFPTDEKKIHSTLGKLAAAISVKGDDGTILRAFKAERAVSFFANELEFQVDGPRDQMPAISTPTDVQQSLLQLYRTAREFEVQLLDILVKVDPDKLAATAFTTAIVRLDREQQPYAQELKLGFEKVQGHWLIRRVHAIQTIQ